MRLWLNPEQLASRSLTAGDLVKAVQEQNVQVAAGIVGGQPLPPGTAPFQYTVNAQGRLVDPKQFGEIIIKTGADGSLTRVKDVARVELGAADYTTSTHFNGLPAVGIPIFQLPGSNAIATANAIYKKMEELKKSFPPGVDYSIPYDTTIFVRDSIKDVVKTLFEAIGLVALVVLVFLQSWRASLVPLLAIPVSLVGTFAVMAVFGFSLNNLSLFGLVLAIGIVVDDAIVVVENVDRWIEHGLSPREASYKAMEEVTPAVIAIAFGLTAVFVPVAFISGITGQFYRQFALTISFSTLLSAFNSLTLSPALAALILKPHAAKKDWLTRTINFLFGWFFRLFNRGLEGTNRGYVRILRHIVRLSVARAGGLRRPDRADLFRIQERAPGIHSAAGSGISDHGGSVAGCGVDRSDGCSPGSAGNDRQEDARRSRHIRGDGFQSAHRHESDQRRDDVHAAEPVSTSASASPKNLQRRLTGTSDGRF